VATRNLYTVLSSAFETALESAGWPPALGSPSGTLAAASQDLRHFLCELAGYIPEVQKSSEPHAFRAVEDPAQKVRVTASGEAWMATVETGTVPPSPAIVILIAENPSPFFLILSILVLPFSSLLPPLYLIIIITSPPYTPTHTLILLSHLQ
jgi:hypothetical protein